MRAAAASGAFVVRASDVCGNTAAECAVDACCCRDLGWLWAWGVRRHWAGRQGVDPPIWTDEGTRPESFARPLPWLSLAASLDRARIGGCPPGRRPSGTKCFCRRRSSCA
jgi:hypothetical protein